MDRNGPNLQYLVSWRRKDVPDTWRNATTKLSKHVIHNTGTYVPYEIKVQAINDFGLGPESTVVTGYSGEDREFYCFPSHITTQSHMYINMSVTSEDHAHFHNDHHML